MLINESYDKSIKRQAKDKLTPNQRAFASTLRIWIDFRSRFSQKEVVALLIKVVEDPKTGS